jgi:large subunit ribosomal protein L29
MKLAEQLTEIRALTPDEVTARVKTLEEQIFRLRIQQSMGHTESGNKVRPLRREIARLKTVLHEKGAGD